MTPQLQSGNENPHNCFLLSFFDAKSCNILSIDILYSSFHQCAPAISTTYLERFCQKNWVYIAGRQSLLCRLSCMYGRPSSVFWYGLALLFHRTEKSLPIWTQWGKTESSILYSMFFTSKPQCKKLFWLIVVLLNEYLVVGWWSANRKMKWRSRRESNTRNKTSTIKNREITSYPPTGTANSGAMRGDQEELSWDLKQLRVFSVASLLTALWANPINNKKSSLSSWWGSTTSKCRI